MAMSESEYVPSDFCKRYSDVSDESDSHLPQRTMNEIVFEFNQNTYSWSFYKTKPWRSGKTCLEWITEFLRQKTPRDIGACLHFHVNNDSTKEIVLRRLSGEAIEDNDRVYTSVDSPPILQINLEKVVMESSKKRRKM